MSEPGTVPQPVVEVAKNEPEEKKQEESRNRETSNLQQKQPNKEKQSSQRQPKENQQNKSGQPQQPKDNQKKQQNQQQPKDSQQNKLKQQQQKGQTDKQTAKQTQAKSTSKQVRAPAKKAENLSNDAFAGCFSELPSTEDAAFNTDLWKYTNVPQPIFAYGINLRKGILTDSTLCVKEFLIAFQKAVPSVPELDMKFLKNIIDFLEETIPVLPISVTNALSFLRRKINELNSNDRKTQLVKMIDTYIEERIDAPCEEIIPTTVERIVSDDDIVLIYSASFLIQQVLVQARKTKNFSVVYVSSHPHDNPTQEKSFLKALVKNDIKVTCVFPVALRFAMEKVTKVIVVAEAMFSNGTLLGKIGTALVAHVAKSFNVPFIACCETCKFSENSEFDSVANNFTRSSDAVVVNEELRALLKERNPPNIVNKKKDVINLAYDLTPSDLIVMLVTEFGQIPTTSVPVILREFRADQGYI